ncbi:MAG: hypothetical protein U5K54_25250 [Cytophagales bacterium]|nr:hypothetical protein [Cytophagales bacterium]
MKPKIFIYLFKSASVKYHTLRIVLAIIISTLCIQLLNAQSSKVDSLKHLLATATNDSAKVEISIQISWEYVWSWPDSTIRYANKALELARHSDQKPQQADLLDLLGFAYVEMGNFSIGLEKAFEALAIAKEVDDPGRTLSYEASIGSAYFNSGDYDKARSHFLTYYRGESKVDRL